jgi:hypothetical protein
MNSLPFGLSMLGMGGAPRKWPPETEQEWQDHLERERLYWQSRGRKLVDFQEIPIDPVRPVGPPPSPLGQRLPSEIETSSWMGQPPGSPPPVLSRYRDPTRNMPMEAPMNTSRINEAHLRERSSPDYHSSYFDDQGKVQWAPSHRADAESSYPAWEASDNQDRVRNFRAEGTPEPAGLRVPALSDMSAAAKFPDFYNQYMAAPFEERRRYDDEIFRRNKQMADQEKIAAPAIPPGMLEAAAPRSAFNSRMPPRSIQDAGSGAAASLPSIPPGGNPEEMVRSLIRQYAPQYGGVNATDDQVRATVQRATGEVVEAHRQRARQEGDRRTAGIKAQARARLPPSVHQSNTVKELEPYRVPDTRRAVGFAGGLGGVPMTVPRGGRKPVGSGKGGVTMLSGAGEKPKKGAFGQIAGSKEEEEAIAKWMTDNNFSRPPNPKAPKHLAADDPRNFLGYKPNFNARPRNEKEIAALREHRESLKATRGERMANVRKKNVGFEVPREMAIAAMYGPDAAMKMAAIDQQTAQATQESADRRYVADKGLEAANVQYQQDPTQQAANQLALTDQIRSQYGTEGKPLPIEQASAVAAEMMKGKDGKPPEVVIAESDPAVKSGAITVEDRLAIKQRGDTRKAAKAYLEEKGVQPQLIETALNEMYGWSLWSAMLGKFTAPEGTWTDVPKQFQ